MPASTTISNSKSFLLSCKRQYNDINYISYVGTILPICRLMVEPKFTWQSKIGGLQDLPPSLKPRMTSRNLRPLASGPILLIDLTSGMLSSDYYTSLLSSKKRLARSATSGHNLRWILRLKGWAHRVELLRFSCSWLATGRMNTMYVC